MSDRPSRCRPSAVRRLARRAAGLVPALALAAGLAAALPHVALAQIGGGNSLPGAVLNSPETPESRQAINAFLDAQLAKLMTADAPAVAAARDALIDPIRAPGTSLAFRNVYGELVAAKFTDALDKAAPAPGDEVQDAKNALIRLNLAIVTERAARYTQSEQLGTVVAKLIADPAAQVSLWGVKAASPLLPLLLDNALTTKRDATVPAIVAAARRFPDNGPLAEEIYETLKMRIFDRTSPPAAAAFDNGVPVVLPAVLDVMGLRTAKYGTGGQTPVEPLAEQNALVFVTYPEVWRRLSAADKGRSVGTIRDLMNAAVAAAAEQPSQQARKDLTTLLARIGSALQTVGTALGGAPGGSDAAAGLDRAAKSLSGVSSGTPPDDLKRYAAAIDTAIKVAYPDVPAGPATPAVGATNVAR